MRLLAVELAFLPVFFFFFFFFSIPFSSWLNSLLRPCLFLVGINGGKKVLGSLGLRLMKASLSLHNAWLDPWLSLGEFEVGKVVGMPWYLSFLASSCSCVCLAADASHSHSHSHSHADEKKRKVVLPSLVRVK